MSKFLQENAHICESYTAIRGAFLQHKNIIMPRNTCKIIGQQRVMFNKIVHMNHTITKFATTVPNTCVIMCTHFCKKLTAFAAVALKHRMDPSLCMDPSMAAFSP